MEDSTNDDDAYYLVVAENEKDPNDAGSNEIVLNVFGLNDQDSAEQSYSADAKQYLPSSSLNDVYKLIMSNMSVKRESEGGEEDLTIDAGSDEEFDIKKEIKEEQENHDDNESHIDVSEFLMENLFEGDLILVKRESGDSGAEDFEEGGASSREGDGEEDEPFSIVPEDASEDEVFKSFRASLSESERRGAHGRLEAPVLRSEEDGSFELPYFLGDEEGNYECRFCNHSVANEGAAVRHYRNRHGPRRHRCLACGLGFRRIDYLHKHESRCSAEYAPLLRRARSSITRPVTRPDRAALVPCDVCGKLIRRSNMALHLRVHTDERRYACSLCPARYRTVKALQAHERAHRGARPFQCDKCPNAYTSRTSLYTHRLSHQAATFKCVECNRAFSRKYTLQQHLKTHSGHRRYLCSECGKCLASSPALANHLRRHRGVPPPHPCQQCHKRYSKMSILKVHMKKEHGLELVTRKMYFNYLPYMNKHRLENQMAGQLTKSQDHSSILHEEAVDDPEEESNALGT